MVSEQQVMQFLKMSVFEKQRLKERNPSLYQELFEESERLFPSSGSGEQVELK